MKCDFWEPPHSLTTIPWVHSRPIILRVSPTGEEGAQSSVTPLGWGQEGGEGPSSERSLGSGWAGDCILEKEVGGAVPAQSLDLCTVSLIPLGLSLTERYSRGVTRESPGYHTLPKNAVPVRPLLQVAMRLDCLYLLPEAQ